MGILKGVKVVAWLGVTAALVVSIGAALPPQMRAEANKSITAASKAIGASELLNVELTAASGSQTFNRLRGSAQVNNATSALARGEQNLSSIASQQSGWFTNNRAIRWLKGHSDFGSVSRRYEGSTTERLMNGFEAKKGRSATLNGSAKPGFFSRVFGSGCSDGGAAKFCSSGN